MKNLFDHLNQITKYKNKNYWNSLTEDDKKSWNSYMINRFLSMNYNYIEIIDLLQKYINLDNKLYYILLAETIPRDNKFLKYIKSEKSYNEELINYISKYYSCSRKDTIEYLEILKEEEIISILKNFGLENKVILKLIKKGK